MLFLLATPEYNNIQSNTTKVKVHLRNGVAEILEQHQDLMGKVENNLLEIETTFENRLEKLLFVLQDAVFVVSNKGLDTNVESKNTGVYVYAKRVREITSSTSVDEIVKQYDLKNSELEKESAILEADPNSSKTKSKVFLLKDEVEFLRRAVTIIKGLKS
jgi:hypothetical protein